MSTDLRDLLDERIGAVVPPAGDPARARQEGARIRRRRRVLTGVGTASVLAVLVAGQAVLASLGGPERAVDPLGPGGAVDGLRAYADPGADSITLGGRTFPQGGIDDLATTARATPYGVAFYADGVPTFLDRTGRRTPLEPGAEPSGFTPEMEVDSTAPLLAYGAVVDGRRRIVVRDVSTGERVAGLATVGRQMAIDAFDDGVVFLRDGAGSTAWDLVTGRQTPVHAGCATGVDCRSSRVVDVRNGVLLYSGLVPDGPAAAGYRLVPAEIEARLTYDGSHVLQWSSRLEPTTPGDAPVVLDRGPTDSPAGQWSLDTDGSVLVAVFEDGITVYDCDPPAGRCERLGTSDSDELGADTPLLIGSDSKL